jgi:hypothetical protein
MQITVVLTPDALVKRQETDQALPSMGTRNSNALADPQPPLLSGG